MNIDHLLTPYKLGKAVLTGSGVPGAYDFLAVDCPNVFSHNGRFYMTHIGFDGTGYQTGLAVSDDLVHWEKKGVILKRGGNQEWDKVGMAATAILMDKDLYGGNKIKKWNGRYWMLYHSYPGEGYEAGSAEIGLCWTEDESLMNWHFFEKPVFSYRDGAPWEKGGLYKADLLMHEGKFYLFYNAKNKDESGWIEQTGMAVSDDLVHWTRPFDHPVLPVDADAWDSVFASDPQVFFDSKENRWVMFYYGLGNLSACDGVAVSEDLYNWTKFKAPILTIGGAGSIDSAYVHKPYMIYHEGMLYHFYCACRPAKDDDIAKNGNEFRCISVARSAPWRE